jgi:hypothetical protein
MWGAGRGSGRRTGRGRRYRADSAPVVPISRLAGSVEPVHQSAGRWPNRNAFGRSDRMAAKARAVRLGPGRRDRSSRRAKLAVSSWISFRKRSLSRVRVPRGDAHGFAPPLGTIGGLSRRRNGRRRGHGRFLNMSRLNRLGPGRAGLHDFEHCPTLRRNLPSPRMRSTSPCEKMSRFGTRAARRLVRSAQSRPLVARMALSRLRSSMTAKPSG